MEEITGILKSENLEGQVKYNEINLNKDIITKENNLQNELKSEVINSNIVDNNTDIKIGIKGPSQLTGILGNSVGEENLGRDFIYIKFSNDMPTSDEEISNIPTESTKYMGICITNMISAPSSYTSYSWVRIKGEDGEKGEVGDVGAPGEDGSAFLNIINPLYISDILYANNWITVTMEESRTVGCEYYYQKIDISDTNFQATIFNDTTDNLINLSNNELIQYLKQKLSQNISYAVDLIVSEDIELGIIENINWNYITRTYLNVENEEISGDIIEKIYLYFECYSNKPTIDLKYQLKVI